MLNWEIESKIQSMKNDLFQKVERYEWINKSTETNSRLDSLESSLREVYSENLRLRDRLQALEEGWVR
jgi:hypothetical protein